MLRVRIPLDRRSARQDVLVRPYPDRPGTREIRLTGESELDRVLKDAAFSLVRSGLPTILPALFAEDQARNIFKNTEGTPEINACGDGSSNKHDANCVCETAVREAGKSKRCEKRKEEASKIMP